MGRYYQTSYRHHHHLETIRGGDATISCFSSLIYGSFYRLRSPFFPPLLVSQVSLFLFFWLTISTTFSLYTLRLGRRSTFLVHQLFTFSLTISNPSFIDIHHVFYTQDAFCRSGLVLPTGSRIPCPTGKLTPKFFTNMF